MLNGVCVDPGQTAVLQKGASYYLFPNGDHHFYVSKFPNPEAHKGCFQAKYFQIIEKEPWPQEPKKVTIKLDPEKLYKADLIWRKPGYQSTELKEYYIQPNKTHGYFYHDERLKKCGGCFPLHWFANFKDVTLADNDQNEPSLDILDIIDQEVPDFDINFSESDRISIESEPKIAKYEQLSLFD